MTDDDFLAAIRANPDDDLPRLAYADWLEERGDPRAAFLRIECELAKLSTNKPHVNELHTKLNDVGAGLEPAWVAAITRVAIENCRVLFRFRCPKKWEQLAVSADAAVRFCDTCHKKVFYCPSISEAQDRSWRGECVAVDPRLTRQVRDLYSEDGINFGVEQEMYLGGLELDEQPRFSLVSLWQRLWQRRR